MAAHLDTLRERLSAFYTATVSDTGAHTVTFQPFLGKKIEDRVVAEEWIISDQRWIFLAVCDGHGGTSTVEHTANTLPGRIRSALTAIVQDDLQNQFDRTNVAEAEPIISAMLTREVEALDAEIGKRVQSLCPDPTALTEEQVRALFQEHPDELLRAFAGTTLSAALINITHRLVWGLGVGDSSAVLSTVDSDGKRHAQRLCVAHSLQDPEECARVIAGHPSNESGVVENGRILGWLMLPRAIGDFPLKLPSTYLSHLFRFLPHTGSLPIDKVPERIKTPPYLIATPSVQLTDLEPVWDKKPIVTLFSDGVDLLVDGYVVFRRGSSSGADPCEIVCKLLEDEVDPSVEETLGHPVDPRWSGVEGNKALDVLGNLIGGTSTERLEMMLDQKLLAGRDAETMFYVDDTAVVVLPL
ncbi:protein serine/threonine phosphatase 2C [Daedaleopsis nitida]|nr:protein serine/threonine phosphatase 2C [Daedaleopsis nitida]